jgi:glycosyltransferase involved in cell wall biosynthesis
MAYEALINPALSAARHAYYSITEPLKLKALRFVYEMDHDPGELIYNGPDPLISVYIPTFNRRDLLLSRALKSVVAQSYRNIEIIVAAHGCTDGTVQAVREFAKDQVTGLHTGSSVHYASLFLNRSPYLREIRVIEVPRTRTYPTRTPKEAAENHWLAGPVVPANAALDECRGAWIARIDDDDEWLPDHLEKLLWLAQDANLEFVSSAYETHEKRVAHDGHRIPIGGTQTWLYRSYLKAFKYNPDCWRKRWDRVNDTDLAQRFRNMGVRIGHLNEVTARVLPRPGTHAVGLKAYRFDERATLKRFSFT